MEFHEYRSLSSAFFAAAVDPKQWQSALRRLSQQVPGAKTHIFGHDFGQGTSPIACVHGYDPHWVDLFDRHYAAINPWGEGFFKAALGEVMSADDMFPRDALVKTEFYTDWAKPQGDIIRGGGGVIGRSDKTVAVIGANIPSRYGDRLEEKWLSTVRTLMPVLQQSWAIGQVFAENLVERLLLEKSSATDPALFLLSEAGEITFRNQRGVDVLASDGAVYTDLRGRLRFWEGRAQQVLSHMLKDVLRGPVHAHFRLSSQASNCAVHMTAFDPDDVPEWPLALVLGLHSPSLLVSLSFLSSNDATGQTLVEAYGLSAAQAQVALLLAEGLSLKDISEHRKTSINTVRKQVQNISQKMGLSRQTEIALTVSRHGSPR